MPDGATIEEQIEEHGVESVVRGVLDSLSGLSEDEKTTRILELQRACNVEFGDERARWESWLADLTRRGVVGFGPVPESARPTLPPSLDTLKSVVKEGVLDPLESGPRRVIGGFEIIEKIGEGGMGAVFKARQVSMDRLVALKLLPERLAQNEEFTARFLREARTAAKLDHVNVVRGIDVGRDGEDYYFAMEFVEGESVAKVLKREGVMPEERAVRIAVQVARALSHAWEQKLIHRDIKPDNILLTKNDVAKLADLGLARSTQQDSMMMTQTGVAVGTPHYMSPEQTRGEKSIDIRTDIYSLGATLYHLVTGHTPFSGSTLAVVLTKHLTEPVVPAHIRNPDVSARLSWIISKTMMKDPDERYATPRELMEDLELVADGRDPEHAAPMQQVVVTDATGQVSLMGIKELAQLGAPVETAAPPRSASARPGWVVPASIVGGLAVVGIILALALGGGGGEDKEARRALTKIEIQRDAGDLDEALAEAKIAARVYEDSELAPRFRDILREIRKLIDARERAAEEKTRREEAARALEQARVAERDGKIEDAIARLKASLEKHEDPEVRARLELLEARYEALRLLEEADGLAGDGKLQEALAKCVTALERAPDDLKPTALARRKQIEGRIALGERIAGIEGRIAAKDWDGAWNGIAGVRADELSDPRVDALARRVIEHLRPKAKITGPLGLELTLVPGGTFRMGSEGGEIDERPVRRVTVRPFYMGTYEVTRAQFEAFRRRAGVVSDAEQAAAREPVVSVSWDEAVAFCRHAASIDPSRATYRLPTEAEWEFAARGSGGRVYPWGNDPPTPRHANLKGRDDGHTRLAPVGSFPPGATPEGVQDLIGNAAEWCGDWYDAYDAAATTNPTGPAEGIERVVRGSAYAYQSRVWSRAAMRGMAPAKTKINTIGFRIVRELSEDEMTFLSLSP